MAKVILHADLNNFYASVACLHRPDLREVPVAVCGDPARRHGIVLAKNMPAKRYGIQTGQVLWQAFQLCPRLTTIAPDYREVSRMSQTVRTIFGRYTDRVQPFGIDEAWLDDAEGLHLRGVLHKDFPAEPAVPQVERIVGRDDDQTGAFLPRLPERLPGLDAIPFGAVVFGEDDAVALLDVAADRKGFLAQGGPVERLHRRIEGIAVAV